MRLDDVAALMDVLAADATVAGRRDRAGDRRSKEGHSEPKVR
jgi:hypothetical protein